MSRLPFARLAVAGALLAAAPLLADIRVKGSDTIGGALGPDLAESYHVENPETDIVWEALGSSTAFVGLFDGSAELGASSRPIKPEELAEARKRGLALKEWVVGYDGIAILVHPSNPLPALTIEDASKIFQGRIRNFKEVGGPDRPIRLLARPSYSGTHSFFKEKVVRKGNAKGPEEFAASTEFVEHSGEIARRVAEDPGAISFLGLGWVKADTRAVPISPGRGQGAIVASVETVRDGSYPIFRSLYLYTLGEPQGELRNLMAYILSERGQQLVEENGFVKADVTTPLPYQAARRATPAPLQAVAPTAATNAPAAQAASGTVVASQPAAVLAAAPAPRPAVAAQAPAESPRVVRVFFDFGGARLTDEATLKLSQLAESLRQGQGRALIVGHADAQGSAEANLRVSAARARIVQEELIRLGVSGAQLTLESRGSSEPIATNDSSQGRRQNRRADIVLVGR